MYEIDTDQLAGQFDEGSATSSNANTNEMAITPATSATSSSNDDASPMLRNASKISNGTSIISPQPENTGFGGSPNSLKMKPLQNQKIKNVKMRLWHPNDMLVSFGSTTFVDLPYGSHSFVESDLYLRALCAALHGDTITELRSRLTNISAASTPASMENPSHNPTVPTEAAITTRPKTLPNNLDREIHPLKFIEKAIVKWIENTTELVTNHMPLEYFNTTHTIDDSMHPSLLRSLHTLAREIEVILLDKDVIDILLKKFYSEVYPFYPLIDIPTFEKKLKNVLLNSNGRRYELNLYGSTTGIRLKLESLALFLIIISITLRSPTYSEEECHILKSNALETARQLLIFAQKLLSLLNGFKFTNENVLCSLLYLFLAEYLNPENRDVDITNDKIMTLKCLNTLATQIGLYNDPSSYPRYDNDPFTGEAFQQFRRKLWIGIQSINFQIFTSNGSSTTQNSDYLKIFLDTATNVTSLLSSKNFEVSEIEKKIFSIQEDKYEFHIIVARLMNSCTSLTTDQDLFEILENIKSTLAFMHQRFPISKLTDFEITSDIQTEPQWRNAEINLTGVEATEILNMNILGLSTIMNVYNVLSFHFEKTTGTNTSNNEPYFHKFILEGINAYLKLTTLIVDYLKGNYSLHIKRDNEYCLNKYAVLTLVKLWLSQMAYSLRFSYKKEIRKQQKVINSTTFLTNYPEDDDKLDTLLNLGISHIQRQMQVLVDLAAERLQDTYFGCYQATLMAKYLLYVMDNAALPNFINRFWDRAFNTKEIPEGVLYKLNMKWGLSTKNHNFVMKNLMNPESLKNINLKLLKQIEYMFEDTTFYKHPSPATFDSNNSTPSFDSEELLNQFLEINFDQFLGVINDNLGELPTL